MNDNEILLLASTELGEARKMCTKVKLEALNKTIPSLVELQIELSKKFTEEEVAYFKN